MTGLPALATPLYPLVSWRKMESLLGRKRRTLKRCAAIAGRCYRSRTDRKPQGGERIIDACYGELKEIQRRILSEILYSVELPPTMKGSVPGCCIRDNAALHVCKPEVIRLDLRDCFARIGTVAVYRVFSDGFGCSAELASVLTRLTTFRRRLPQGARTSSMLCNLVLLPMHKELLQVARRHGLVLSQWVDDICVSGIGAVRAIGDFMAVIRQFGHAVRRQKIYRMPRTVQQWVTGSVVNSRISAGRERIQKVREQVLGHKRGDEGVSLPSLMGHIAQIGQLNRQQGAKLQALLGQSEPV